MFFRNVIYNLKNKTARKFSTCYNSCKFNGGDNISNVLLTLFGVSVLNLLQSHDTEHYFKEHNKLIIDDVKKLISNKEIVYILVDANNNIVDTVNHKPDTNNTK